MIHDPHFIENLYLLLALFGVMCLIAWPAAVICDWLEKRYGRLD